MCQSRHVLLTCPVPVSAWIITSVVDSQSLENAGWDRECGYVTEKP